MSVNRPSLLHSVRRAATRASEQAGALVGIAPSSRGGSGTTEAPRSDALTRAPMAADVARRGGAGRVPGDSHGQIGWLLRGSAPTTDATATFQRLNAQALAGTLTLPAEAKNHVYLLVPGLFTERYPGYLDANEKRLTQLGLSVRRAPIDTDAGVAANAAVIRDEVMQAAAQGRKVVLLGHSKGGVDATAALSLYPDLKHHVRAVVAMQTPYAGTPMATDLLDCDVLRPVVSGAIRNLFHGDVNALADLRYAARREFLAAHPYPADIPTVSLASRSDSLLSVTAKASGYIRLRYGEASDGLVVQKDARIPGSHVVELSALDHACAAIVGPVQPRYPQGALTEALVALALQVPGTPR